MNDKLVILDELFKKTDRPGNRAQRRSLQMEQEMLAEILSAICRVE